jgi:hypothetical protein
MTADTPADFRVLGFFPADHAEAVNGKVYVNGGFWNMLRFASFPAVTTFSLVAVIEVPFRAYHQNHSFSLGLEDADKNALPLQIEGEFRVGSEPHMRTGDPTVMPFAVTVNSFVFEKPGDYSFVVGVDGHGLDRFPVRVVQVAGAGPVTLGPPSGNENRPEAED